MARITNRIKLHMVIVDSNTLFSPDKKVAVSPLFDDFWSKYSKDCHLSLYIPQIVLGELKFQHFKKTINSYKHIAHEIEEIAEVTQKKYTHTITESSLRQKIDAKFKKWLSSKNAKILLVPIEKIDWSKLIEMAIWRQPPFSFEENREKGFRDSLILETIDSFCKVINSNLNVTFICNDELLCTSVKNRLKSNPRFTTYSALADFENYLKLEKQKFGKEFIDEVLKNASAKFFQPNNRKSIYYLEKIKDRLLPHVEKYINNPEMATVAKAPSFLESLLAGAQSVQTWEQVDSGMYWIMNPEIENINEGKYSWTTKINYVKQYKKKGATLLTENTYEERVLVLTFTIYWSTQVSKDARFWGIKIDRTGLSATSFDKPTETQVRQWRLKPEPTSQ